MAIPAATLSRIKNFLSILDTDRNDFIQSIYERELRRLLRQLDLVVTRTDQDSVVDQSIYSTADGTYRILTVTHNMLGLLKTTSWARDIAAPSWQGDAAADPEVWWQDRLPQELDSLSAITPLEFAIHPAPSVGFTNGLGVFATVNPTDDDPPMTWIDPYLVYQTTGMAMQEIAEEREQEMEGRAEVSTATSQFFLTLASVWLAVIRQRVGL